MNHPEYIAHADTVAYADEGHKDAMGCPFSTWRLARYHEDGRVMRDANGRQVFMTQAEWKAKYAAAAVMGATACGQMDLFA